LLHHLHFVQVVPAWFLSSATSTLPFCEWNGIHLCKKVQPSTAQDHATLQHKIQDDSESEINNQYKPQEPKVYSTRKNSNHFVMNLKHCIS